MKFDDLDKKMRIYEQSLDQILLPEIYMVARLDGRGFTRLTKGNFCAHPPAATGNSPAPVQAWEAAPSCNQTLPPFQAQYEKEGQNPVTGKSETAVRSRLKVEYELPLGE